MKLIFSGHTFKYETESLCKLFFSCVRFQIEYDTRPSKDEENYIFTRVVKGKTRTLCYARVRLDGVLAKQAYSLPNTQAEDKKTCELTLCKALYKALCTLTGITPAWGVLTGIRPVKRIQQHRADGMTDAEIAAHLRSNYLVSDAKIDLGLHTATTQAPILHTTDNFSYSLYVAIPFCPSRCSYCSFISQSAAAKKIHAQIPTYLEYLYQELHATAQVAKRLGLTLKTVYIGGGTPTVLSAEQLSELTAVIEREFDFSDLCEYTIEAGRPDSITRDKLRAIKAAGVTRISINPQTLNDEVLVEIGRKHTAADFLNCFELARNLGFDNINTDFIAGLPKDTAESFANSIDRVLELAPENITVHTLSYKKAARMYTDTPIKSLQSDPTGEMVDYACKMLLASGYDPYYLYRQKNTVQNLENVGYATPGHVCLYNVYIMEETHTILACGASASTKLVNIDKGYIERVFNYKYPLEYTQQFDEMLRRKEEIVRFFDEQFQRK